MQEMVHGGSTSTVGGMSSERGDDEGGTSSGSRNGRAFDADQRARRSSSVCESASGQDGSSSSVEPVGFLAGEDEEGDSRMTAHEARATDSLQRMEEGPPLCLSGPACRSETEEDDQNLWSSSSGVEGARMDLSSPSFSARASHGANCCKMANGGLSGAEELAETGLFLKTLMAFKVRCFVLSFARKVHGVYFVCCRRKDFLQP